MGFKSLLLTLTSQSILSIFLLNDSYTALYILVQTPHFASAILSSFKHVESASCTGLDLGKVDNTPVPEGRKPTGRVIKAEVQQCTLQMII